jgi:DNA replication protein DnaC
LLVIDDIHAMHDTAAKDAAFLELIRSRHDSHSSTVLITNQTAEESCLALGYPIQNRIEHRGGFIEFNWPSFRR